MYLAWIFLMTIWKHHPKTAFIFVHLMLQKAGHSLVSQAFAKPLGSRRCEYFSCQIAHDGLASWRVAIATELAPQMGNYAAELAPQMGK